MSQANAHYVDADINPDTIAGWTDVRSQARDLWYPSNWTHLEAEEVQVLGDGAFLGTDTIASGISDLDDNTTTNHVGLAYTSELKPMKLDLERMGIAWVKGIVQAIVSFYQTLGGRYGDSTSNMTPIILRDRDDAFGAPPGLYTDTIELPYDSDYTREGDLIIQQTQPLPMTIRGIILPVGVYDDG